MAKGVQEKGKTKKEAGASIGTKLNRGYLIVIAMMVISSVISLICLAVLNNRIYSFVNGSSTADTAIKICRIDRNQPKINDLRFFYRFQHTNKRGGGKMPV